MNESIARPRSLASLRESHARYARQYEEHRLCCLGLALGARSIRDDLARRIAEHPESGEA